MPEKTIKWTEQQKRAITARGSDVLVTASAGTGKTAVLSGRCASIVGDKSLCPDVWSILVLTFTDMAAEQMRCRIAGQLQAAFSQSGDPHLRHQLMLLPAADISTIHSFCKRLITEYFYKLGLDPTFRVIDADEARLLKAEILEKTIDWAWQQSHLQAPLNQLLYRRNLSTNKGFLARIIELNDFLETVVSRENWFHRAALLADAADPFTTDLGKKQKQIVTEKLQYICNRLWHARQLYERQAADRSWADSLTATHIQPVQQCIELLEAGNWDKATEIIRNFKKPTTRKPKKLPEPMAGLLQDMAEKAVKDFSKLSCLAIVNPEYLDMFASSVSRQTKVMLELVKKFDQLFSQAKRAVNCLDFADLEHYALKLLAGDSISQDSLSPTETALTLRQKYKFIFVDEYQDINPVQQAILDMLSSGGNILEVGDVKQSIYAFRGAEPAIFLQRLKQASVDQKKPPHSLRVDLNVNFRSDKRILDFVNKIFSRIMTEPFARIDYDESAKLRPAPVRVSHCPDHKAVVADGKNVVEFHILDETGPDADLQAETPAESTDDASLNVITARQRQAAMIARRIRQMVGAETGRAEFQIYDSRHGCLRDVEYRDIVVLMRSLVKKANDYVEIFRLAGIPVSCQATAGYFETTEITDMLCLLKVLDNPQRDIELAAVLRSPFFKISDSELSKVRIHSGANKHNFYNSVVQYCKNGPDTNLTEKLKKILDRIEQWRIIARRGQLPDLIWQIYRQTGYLSFISAQPCGQARRANLLKLHDRAIQFESFATSGGRASLSRFVQFIERLQETGQDWAPAEPPDSAGNTVRIISVHKSKGLEFPVVFLAELESGFNKRDITADLLADARNTLGLQIIDHESNSKLSSLAHQVIAEQKLATALAEEMRILYVATTRARDRLILTASAKKKYCQKILHRGALFGDGPIPDWQLRACKSPLEWILYGLCDQKNLHSAFETSLPAPAADHLFNLKLYDHRQLQQLARFVHQLRNNKLTPHHTTSRKTSKKPVQSKLLSQVKKSLSWRYQFGDAPFTPAKTSVTELTHHSDEYARFDYSRAFERMPRAIAAVEPLEGRLIGTATHLVIARLDLARPVTKQAIDKTVEKLLTNGAITEAMAGYIDTQSIMTFFKSRLGQIALSPENTICREWPFTFALPASEFSGPGHDSRFTNDETIIVQGIIDMLVQTPQGLMVIDFKTDQISEEHLPQQAELYRQQLNLYGKAASAILKTKILGKWLYFLTPAADFEIK